jgi:ribonuclease D
MFTPTFLTCLFKNKVVGGTENWSLGGLVRNLFHCKINKDPLLRKGDWSKYPLTEEQKCYAATDAFVQVTVVTKFKLQLNLAMLNDITLNYS